jgi:hypothetical protein
MRFSQFKNPKFGGRERLSSPVPTYYTDDSILHKKLFCLIADRRAKDGVQKLPLT